MTVPGCRIWAIPEGYIPSAGIEGDSALVSHEAACILNAGGSDAQLTIMLYFEDTGPAGPYHVTVGAHRTVHLRMNGLTDPEPVPRDTSYASLDKANRRPHTRLDSRDSRVALLSTMAFPQG
jgi:hypothetical protein